MEYKLQIIFAAIRLTIAFWLLFGWLAPKFLRYAGKQTGIDRIIYSWVGLGGTLIALVFLLVQLRLYDFISLLFMLIALPVVYGFLVERRKNESLSNAIYRIENLILYNQIRLLEKFSFERIKEKLRGKLEFNFTNHPYKLTAIILAILGSVLRIIPAYQNASPFSRSWYFELEAVKNLSLQTYFGNSPSPKGMHSLVHIFSTLTQISPEMILHMLGSLTSFFLTVIIFWVIRDITKDKYPSAALLGAGTYALFPVLFMPITFELQTTSSSLSLALCFAIPTAVFFLRKIRREAATPWLYLVMGIIATGLVDLFVFIVVLLPTLLVSLIAIRSSRYIMNFGKSTLYIIGTSALTLSPYFIYSLFHNINLVDFIQSQLFDSRVFSFYPDLITEIDYLSTIYFGIGSFLFLVYILLRFIRKDEGFGEELVYIAIFCLVSFIYTPYFQYDYVYIDPDQLNSFYSILIAIFFGICLHSLFLLLEWVFKNAQKQLQVASIVLTIGAGVGMLFLQGGVKTSRVLPQTLPNGFFNAYYEIISKRVPYTYAIVGPELDRTLSKNRHFFMNYTYFLNNYGAIDSLYQQYLTVPDIQRENQEVPPASIFLFVEKPPFGSIQQGILYDSPGVMRDMEQWLSTFQTLENRNLQVYYEDENARVYEIVNRENESDIYGILLNMYPEDQSRAAKLFK